MTDEQVRLFVAIELPEEERSYLADLQVKLREREPSGVRWVRPEGVHLTLKFLGGVTSTLVPAIEAAIAAGCQSVRPFSVKLANLGVFPNRNRPRVVWVGVEGDLSTLTDLQRRVDKELAQLGFAEESRPSVPHLTLGRVEETATLDMRRRIGGLVEAAKVAPSCWFEVRAVSLMRSELMPGGAVYSRLGSIGL